MFQQPQPQRLSVRERDRVLLSHIRVFEPPLVFVRAIPPFAFHLDCTCHDRDPQRPRASFREIGFYSHVRAVDTETRSLSAPLNETRYSRTTSRVCSAQMNICCSSRRYNARYPQRLSIREHPARVLLSFSLSHVRAVYTEARSLPARLYEARSDLVCLPNHISRLLRSRAHELLAPNVPPQKDSGRRLIHSGCCLTCREARRA